MSQDKFIHTHPNLQSDLRFTNILLTLSNLKIGRGWPKAASRKPSLETRSLFLVYFYFLNLLGKKDYKIRLGKGKKEGNEHFWSPQFEPVPEGSIQLMPSHLIFMIFLLGNTLPILQISDFTAINEMASLFSLGF